MILRTGNMESIPVILVAALAKDADDWWIELHLEDGTMAEGYLLEVDEQLDEVRVQNEAGEHPWGQTISWNDVSEVVIP